MCVRPNVIFLARMMWVLNRKMFYGDLEMLRQLGRTTNTRELRYELESFRHYHPPRGFLRRDLKVRVSGRRLLKIASRLFGIEATRKARSLTITTPTLNMPGSNSATKPAETTTAPTSNQTSPGVETTATQKNI
ncbi:MAG: hypothetical protein N2487_03525 [Verrucomicrobiae bacterium]|nr:hypothetical protein [Verrucomicrobiae bacterium]